MTTFGIFQNVQGRSGHNSLIAWSGEPFKVYATFEEANTECIRHNRISKENGINREPSYVAEGNLTEVGFLAIKEFK